MTDGSPTAPAPPPAPGTPYPPHPQPAHPPARGGFISLLPQLVWEAVLLLMVVVVLVAAASRVPIFNGPAVWWSIAGTGLLASGLALSLRTGTPNLAVPALASLAAMVFAQVTENGWPMLPAAAVALALIGLLGMVLGLVTGLTSAPAWAVSLGGLGLGSAMTLLISGGMPIRVVVSAPPSGLGYAWFGLFVVLSVGGGLLFLLPPVQRWSADRAADRAAGSDTGSAAGSAAGRDAGRRTGDYRPGFSPAFLVRALVGFTGSSLLAGTAGLVISTRTLVATPGVELSWLVIALGAAVLGGVSVFSGRGGIAGTVLAATLLAVITFWLQLEGVAPGPALLVGGLAVFVGLAVSRILVALTPPVPAQVPAPPLPAQVPAPPPPAAIG